MKNQKGITMVALVITIIVLLILAGVTMNLTLGEHGIFGTAMSAAEKSKIAEYKDKVELARVDVSSENMGIATLDNLIDKIYEQKIVPEGSIEKIDEEKEKMTTPEGYVFVITADKIEYVGKTEDIPPVPEIDLDKGDIEVSIDPETWTNNNVKVTMINHEEGDYTLQYSINKGLTYTNYTEPITIEQITTIYIRLMNPLGETGTSATYKISNIDKIAPIDFTPTVNATTNSITINASGAMDGEATEKYGKSGIKEIWYSNDDGTTWDTNEDKTSTTYTFINLTQKTLYKTKVKVIDNAGNETITSTQEIITKEVTGATSSDEVEDGNITFTQTPTGWTNGNVEVSATTTEADFILQLSKSTTFPETTEAITSITATENGTVYARLIDSTGQYNGTASTKVTTIDREKPVIGTVTSTISSVTFTGTDNASGIKYYAVTTTNTEPTTEWTILTDSTTDLTATTVSNLSQNTTYYVWIKDEAENVSACGTTKTTTQPVTSITLSPTTTTIQPGGTVNLTATVNPSNAYNKAITWSSSNTGVATVSNGKVTAVAAGTTTITATAQDGSNVKGSCTITVSNPLLSAKITATNYGDYVNYPVDLNGDGNYTNDWRIFYKDSSGYVYIVASYYLPYSKVPSGTQLTSYSGKPYTAYWGNEPTSYATISSDVRTRYKMSWSSSTSNANIIAVSQLLNTSVWSSFVNTTYAKDAIGAPTLEMWVDSWNAKGNTKLYYNNSNSYGYYVGTSSIQKSYYVAGLSTSDSLYFPVTSSTASDANGYRYWLASPSANGISDLMYVEGELSASVSSVSCDPYSDYSQSVRPLVCLKSTLYGQKNANGVWQLK